MIFTTLSFLRLTHGLFYIWEGNVSLTICTLSFTNIWKFHFSFIKISTRSKQNICFRSSHQRCSMKKGEACNFVKKETPALVFYCEFYEISKNTLDACLFCFHFQIVSATKAFGKLFLLFSVYQINLMFVQPPLLIILKSFRLVVFRFCFLFVSVFFYFLATQKSQRLSGILGLRDKFLQFIQRK